MPPKTSSFTRERDDFYRSPDGVIEPLLRYAPPPAGAVWEPAAGDGALVDQLRGAGVTVAASDLVYRHRDSILTPVDFLLEYRLLNGAQSIITNPPFKNADDFIAHSLRLGAVYVAMLLPLKWLGATGPRWALTRHVTDAILLGRLKMLPPSSVDKGHSGTVDFAWLVFRQEPSTAPTIRFHNAKNAQNDRNAKTNPINTRRKGASQGRSRHEHA